LRAHVYKEGGHAGEVLPPRPPQWVIDVYLEPTARFMTMLTTSMKMATVLGHMRWHVVHFDGPLLAYSDHPVVLWPMFLAIAAPFKRQGLAPMAALEIRVPIAPNIAIVMNWIDRTDESALLVATERCRRAQRVHGCAGRPSMDAPARK
jgi:hypothetical protein